MGQSFINWLTGNMGVPGEYMYQPIHLIPTGIVLLLTVAVVLYGRANQTKKRRLLVGIALFQLLFEITWRIIYFFVKGDPLVDLWPMYPCNLGGILVPLIALCNWRTGKRMFYLFAFIGGCLTFAMPEGIFTSNALNFPILKSILQHTGLLLIPALEYADGSFRATLRDFPWCVLGCLVHVVNCEWIDRLLGFTGDYLFFKSGIPFTIPGVPGWITVSVFALIVFAAISLLTTLHDRADKPRRARPKKEKSLA